MTNIPEGSSSVDANDGATERLIDFEIGRIDARQRNRGWTPWALYAAFGGLIWVILKEAENGGSSFENVALLWALLVYSKFTLKVLRAFLGGSKSAIGGPSRFAFSNQEMGSQRMALCVHFACMSGAFLLFGHHTALLSLPAKIAFFALSGVVGAMLLVVLVMSYFDIPVPKGDESPSFGTFLFSALIAVVASYVTISLWVVEAQQNGMPTIATWKFALAAFAAIEVLEFLLAFQSDEPFLNNLTSIKRDLLLGHLSQVSAKSQLDITLKGMRAGHVMQRPVKDYLALIDSVEQKLRIVSEQQGKMWSILLERHAALTSDDEELIRTRFAVMKTALDECAKIMDSVGKLRNRISSKSRLLARIAPNCSKDIEAIWTEMSTSLDRVKAVASASGATYKEIQAKLQASNKPELAKLWQ